MDGTRIDDPWLLQEPRTSEQVAALRKEKIAFYGPHVSIPETFTCDGCGLVNVCTLAFDPYNSDGDCLHDK